MFTGIITAQETVASTAKENEMVNVVISRPKKWELEVGESININGVCSTVTEMTADDFTVAYMPESLRLTTASELEKGSKVNLERSLQMKDLLSGHTVSGHTDTTGQIKEIVEEGDSYTLTISYDKPQYIIHKGSVAVNGISLTAINPTDDTFQVSLIPHTWENTNLSSLKVGDLVNIEYDMIAKYIERQQKYV